MEQNNQRNSRKRLNSLILLVAFTAIMLIVSTYAWFSINNEVSITNLKGIVNVVEGLQISLDAQNWTDTLDLSTLNLLTDAYVDNSNFVPTELLPVSTTGVAAASTAELPMYRGTNTAKIALSNIVATVLKGTTAEANPETYPGYYAFDIFLMNSGAADAPANEVLQLNSSSSLTIVEDGNEDSGLQNTVRVGFAKYSGTADVTASATEVIAATNAGDSYISDMAIWEPNANAHIQNIVNNNNLLMLDASVAGDWELTKAPEDTYYLFDTTKAVPTYALTTASVGKAIANIYDWKASPTVNEDAGKLAIQHTLQTNTTDDGTTKTVYNLKSTKDGTTNFQIPTNAIVKLRVYIWLEGQDVDCTNYASHGGGIDVNIGFIKNEPGISN